MRVSPAGNSLHVDQRMFVERLSFCDSIFLVSSSVKHSDMMVALSFQLPTSWPLEHMAMGQN